MNDASFLPLTDAQKAAFHEQGWLILRGALDPVLIERITEAAEQLEAWSELDGPGLHHFEQTDRGVKLARSEDLVTHHPVLDAFIRRGAIAQWVGELLDEPAVLYKEKINYKQAGGAGFAAHQDASAYRFVAHHISVMVPIDTANSDNGGLEFAPGHTQGLLPQQRGVIEPAVAEALAWSPTSVEPGDVVLFDSYAPHRSGTNASDRPRRAYYLTYNALSAGDFRDRYYADKVAEFHREGHSFDGERARISVNDDFLGRPAAPPATPSSRPLEHLFALYEGPQAQQLYDEAITELEHGLQCAALARHQGASDAAVAAALLHDVGHLLVGDLFPIDATLTKDWKHEEVGARYLSRWFGPEVCEPVRMHVAAKRYLVATDAAYAAALTPSSTRSLAVQGGPMSDAECAQFEALDGFRAAVAVRRWDDAGKDPAVTVAPFSAYLPMLRRLAAA